MRSGAVFLRLGFFCAKCRAVRSVALRSAVCHVSGCMDGGGGLLRFVPFRSVPGEPGCVSFGLLRCVALWAAIEICRYLSILFFLNLISIPFIFC